MDRSVHISSATRELVGIAVQIGLVLFSGELLLLSFAGAGPEAGRSLLTLALDAALITLFSAPLLYFWIVRPFVTAALRANAELTTTAARLDEALRAKCDQSDALEQALARLRLQQHILDRLAILSETTPRGEIVEVNDNFCRISGYTRGELIGRTHSVVNSGHHPKAFWTDMFATMAKGEVWQGEVCNRRKDGSTYWVRCFNAAIRDRGGKLMGYMSLRVDITEMKEIQTRLSEQNMKLDAALSHMSQGLVMFDDQQKLVMCNEKYAEMYGLPENLCAPGTPLTAVIGNHVATNVYRDGMPDDYLPERIADVALVRESMHVLTNGNSLAVVRSKMPGGGWVSTHEDITHRRKLEERVAHLAMHDGLTDLPNRVLLRERLASALDTRKDGESVAILYLDLDRFKDVNDTLGHPVGDALLKAVAERIKGCVRKSDTVARIGGDEFVVVHCCSDPMSESAFLAERLIERISAPYVIDGHAIGIGVSIGIAVAPADGTEQELLVHVADAALYRSKRGGRGTYHFADDKHGHERRKMSRSSVKIA
jgi:diguanylate cyclase (GGDEF)-like protein/PAS domain S-box-containing protein